MTTEQTLSAKLDARPATFTCDKSKVGPLYYFAITDRAPGPYKTQRHVEAILDIADDGTLAGVELIDSMPPPPLAQQALRTTEAGEVVAWRDVLAERQRQIATEGWTPDHDDEHDKGELAKAAGVYALAAASHDYRYALQGLPVNDYLAATFKMWPWHWGWFKPKDRRRDCVKAAALLLAEIERLDRAALSALEHQP